MSTELGEKKPRGSLVDWKEYVSLALLFLLLKQVRKNMPARSHKQASDIHQPVKRFSTLVRNFVRCTLPRGKCAEEYLLWSA